MYRIYIPNANMKDIFKGRIDNNNTAGFKVDSFDEMQKYALYFIEKGFIVIVEPLKDGD